MSSPIVIIPDLIATQHHTLHIGSIAFTAVAGSFVGSKLIIRIGTATATAIELESDDVDDGITWSGGTLSAWELTPTQIDTLAALGAPVGIWITLEEADPSNNVTLMARCNKITLKLAPPDIP